MSEPIDTLYKLQKKDLQKASNVLSDAFQHNPLWNNVFGSGLKAEREIYTYEALVRYALKYGEAYAPSENLEGIATWVTDKFAGMDLWQMLWSGVLVSGLKLGIKPMMTMMPVFEVMEKDREENMKGKPHLHLQVLGVATEFQRRGFGGELLRKFIERSQQAGVFAYLETQTETNFRMYERFGFELINHHMLPVVNVPVWEMMREPKAFHHEHRQTGI